MSSSIAKISLQSISEKSAKTGAEPALKVLVGKSSNDQSSRPCGLTSARVLRIGSSHVKPRSALPGINSCEIAAEASRFDPSE